MRCLIVDDDELSRSVIEDLVSDTDSLELIKSCSDAIDAFNTLKTEHIDLVFLDIEIANASTFSIASSNAVPGFHPGRAAEFCSWHAGHPESEIPPA